MLTVLALITLLSGGGLGYMYNLTKGPIAQAEEKQKEEAIRQVAPEFDNSPIKERQKMTVGGKEVFLYPATKNRKWQGAAVEVTTDKGYNGEIRLMVGFDAGGSIRNYRVLKHKETPGLGSKMEIWFRTEKNRQNILGKKPAESKLTVSKDGGDIDAITAATISSRAFLDAVQRAYAAFTGDVDGTTAASQQTEKEKKQ